MRMPRFFIVQPNWYFFGFAGLSCILLTLALGNPHFMITAWVITAACVLGSFFVHLIHKRQKALEAEYESHLSPEEKIKIRPCASFMPNPIPQHLVGCSKQVKDLDATFEFGQNYCWEPSNAIELLDFLDQYNQDTKLDEKISIVYGNIHQVGVNGKIIDSLVKWFFSPPPPTFLTDDSISQSIEEVADIDDEDGKCIVVLEFFQGQLSEEIAEKAKNRNRKAKIEGVCSLAILSGLTFGLALLLNSFWFIGNAIVWVAAAFVFSINEAQAINS